MSGGAVWLGASLLVAAIGWFGVRRLLNVGQQLEARTHALEKANAELELAARSSAIGAISGRLLHGLKNPLAGLAAYLRAHGDDDAREAARRMQHLVGETMAVLRNVSREGRAIELSLGEIMEMLRSRLSDAARAREVEIQVQHRVEGSIESRDANLIVLILENLLHNSIETSPAGGVVEAGVDQEPAGIRFYVSDRGTGISAEVREHLFEPGCSTKEGGSGLGLAISRQLARSVGGELNLVHTGPTGCRFDLVVPATILKSVTEGAT